MRFLFAAARLCVSPVSQDSNEHLPMELHRVHEWLDAPAAYIFDCPHAGRLVRALSDLLPEVHFHSHDRIVLTLAFLQGIGIAYAIGALEPGNLHH